MIWDLTKECSVHIYALHTLLGLMIYLASNKKVSVCFVLFVQHLKSLAGEWGQIDNRKIQETQVCEQNCSSLFRSECWLFIVHDGGTPMLRQRCGPAPCVISICYLNLQMHPLLGDLINRTDPVLSFQSSQYLLDTFLLLAYHYQFALALCGMSSVTLVRRVNTVF